MNLHWTLSHMFIHNIEEPGLNTWIIPHWFLLNFDGYLSLNSLNNIGKGNEDNALVKDEIFPIKDFQFN